MGSEHTLYNIKVEAVAITKAGASNYLNGENFNLNGRVLSAADADKGYKGAGNLSGAFVLGLCSGKAETRSATTAMKVLTSHLEEIKLSREDYEMAINRYFDNARRDVSLLANDYAAISASLLYVYDNNAVVAGLGQGKCFRIVDGTVETISSPEAWNESELAAPYYYNIDNIESQNTFLLCSPGVYEYVSENEIASIIETATSTKQAAQKIQNAAIANGSQKDITLLLASLVPSAGSAFGGVAPVAYSQNDETMAMPSALYDEQGYEYTEPVEEKAGSGISKGPIILISILSVILLFLVGFYIYEKVKSEPANATTTESSSTEETLTTEHTTQGTTASRTTESTTEDDETTRQTTTKSTTTTKPTTTKPTTTKPTTTKPTTTAPTTTKPTTTKPTTEPTTEERTTAKPTTTEREVQTIREQPED